LIVFKRFLTLICFFSISIIYSHGDLHERILEVTEEIKKTPDSAYLFFKRGKLFFQHDDHKSSLKDLKKSRKLGFQDIEQDLLFSKNYFEIGDYNKALKKINSLLDDDKQNVVFLKIKARVYFKKEEFELSAKSFESVIAYSSKTFPENYIECAHSWLLTNTENGYSQAIKVLDLGIKNLGNVISLLEEKVSLYSKKADYELAIASQNLIIDILNRKEHAYFVLAELYFKNENFEEGKIALQKSMNSINKLPNRIKNTQNIKNLIAKISELEININ
jgi:predicted Zn-dependent protease